MVALQTGHQAPSQVPATYIPPFSAGSSTTAVASPTEASSGSKRRTALLVGVLLLAVCAAGALGFVLTQSSGGDKQSDAAVVKSVDESESASETVTVELQDESTISIDAPRSSAAPLIASVPSTMTTIFATTVPPTPRPGTLYAGTAVIRASPGGAEIARIVGREGASLTVVEAAGTHGWYKVSIDGYAGYLYGAFVLPPDPGLCIGQTDGRKPLLYDQQGSVLNASGPPPSGDKIVIVGPQESSFGWPAVGADGVQGYIRSGDVSVRCQ